LDIRIYKAANAVKEEFRKPLVTSVKRFSKAVRFEIFAYFFITFPTAFGNSSIRYWQLAETLL
jgi:hypothetical protein